MRIELPIFEQICDDTTLPPRSFQVWRRAIQQLDLVEWRELSQNGIALLLRIDRSTVARSIELLVSQGWICKREQGRGLPALYRVPLSRGQTGEAVEWPDDARVEPTAQVKEEQRVGPRVIGRSVV